MEFLFVFLLGLVFWVFDFLWGFIALGFTFLFFLIKYGGFVFAGAFFLDSLSFSLVFLSILLFCLCLFSSLSDWWLNNGFNYFVWFLSFIFLFVVFSFCFFSFLLFYVSFEFIFVLMFLFLISWGYSPERLQASLYMVFYTLVVSLPFLLFVIFNESFSIGMFKIWSFDYRFWGLAFVLVFLVKLPVYGVHLWLPKAHVEAPVSGSMLLAGILLKLGGYGLLRFFTGKMSFFFCSFHWLVSLGLLGGFYSCLLCLRQVDMKAYVAYSSVCHMGYGLGGMFVGLTSGYSGGVMMLIGHGFCSSCLFYLLYVFYERYFSRSLILLKGSLSVFPLIGLFWFIFLALNSGVPPSFPFFSEVAILSGLSGLSFFSFAFSGLLLFFSGVYGMFLYVVCCHGSGVSVSFEFFLGVREYLSFFGHLFFLLFFVLCLDLFYLV